VFDPICCPQGPAGNLTEHKPRTWKFLSEMTYDELDEFLKRMGRLGSRRAPDGSICCGRSRMLVLLRRGGMA
jgi:hypothetical protein